ncbi:hypothetical protein VR010_07665 [Actinomycetaceae bacterium L2_0104]
MAGGKVRKAGSYLARRGQNDMRRLAGVILGAVLLIVSLLTVSGLGWSSLSLTLVAVSCITVMTSGIWTIPSAAVLAVVLPLVWFTPERALQLASTSMFFMVLMLLWDRHRKAALILGTWYLLCVISLIIPDVASVSELVTGALVWTVMMVSFALAGEFLGSQRVANEELDARRREELMEQRRAIARELHDTAVYSTTMVVMRAEAVKLGLSEAIEAQEALEKGLEISQEERRVRQVRDEYRARLFDDLDFIARTGRRATSDLRSMLSVLRMADGVTDVDSLSAAERFTIPSTSLGGILLEQANKIRSAGLEVQTAIEGDLDSVPEEVNVAFAKILTEACSNMVKHASRQVAATIMIDVQDEVLEAAFVNGLSPAGSPLKESVRHDGLGIVGLRERAESLGGTIEVSATDSRWIVRVSLPIRR